MGVTLTLRQGHRPRVSENRVLIIFRQKRDYATGGWRKLRNELSRMIKLMRMIRQGM
jgi:hypothetical protein